MLMEPLLGEIGQREQPQEYFAVNVTHIRPWVRGLFPVYLRQHERFVLYTNEGEAYSTSKRDKLLGAGVSTVYIPISKKSAFEEYTRSHLVEFLEDDDIPMQERVDIWYRGSLVVMKEIFEEKLPAPLRRTRFKAIAKLVQDSIAFFSKEGVIKYIVKMLSKGFKEYNHSLGTMVLTLFVLETYKEQGLVTKELCKNVCIGALLHDIGKVRLPNRIIPLEPETLQEEDREAYETHPNLGVGLCVDVPIAVETFHCILFHHELDNGEGFPSKLMDDSIPFYVKVLRVCNYYDELTRTKENRKADTAFNALQRIKNRKILYGEEYVKRLILVLANADMLGNLGGTSSSHVNSFYQGL